MPTGIRMYMGEPTGNTGPSPLIWADCPVLELIEDPSKGYYYFEDFVGPLNPTDDDGYAITTTTSGELRKADYAGGAMVVDSAGHASADDGIEAQLAGECWKPAANKTLWFEARVKFSDVATTPDQFFIGLATTDTSLFAGGELDESNNSLLGFYTDANSTAGDIEFISCKAGSAEIDTDGGGGDAEDDTWYKLGFKVYTEEGQLKVDYFVDGELVGTITDTDDIPVTEMALSFVAKCEQTSADAEMTVDWVRIAQLR